MMSLISLLLLSNAFTKAFALPQTDLSLQQSTPALSASHSTNQPNPLTFRSAKLDQTIASFTEQGLCFHYFAEQPPSHPNPCIEYCKNNGGHGYSGCNVTSYNGIDIETNDQSIINTDDAGFRWIPAPCECTNPSVEEITTSIFSAVAQGLDKIDNVLCAEWTQAFNDISNLGTSIPHTEVLTAAVSAAKTFAQNGLEAREFFDDWVGDVCGVPDWDSQLWVALLGAPDSVGKSVGCFRKNRVA